MKAKVVLADRTLTLLGELRGQYCRAHPTGHENLPQSATVVFPTVIPIGALALPRRSTEQVWHGIR